MNRKIALLPVDARPVTRDLPCQLAAIGGWEILVPECEYLGFLKEPGNIKELQQWLEKTVDEVDGLVISIDMLGYGGLVPSRISDASIDEVRSRIQLISKLKEKNPNMKIMCFSATMRISNSYVNEEEKDYWDRYGVELWTYSYYSHRYAKTKDPASKKLVERLKPEIPDWILEDYKNTRERNFAINRTLLDEVESGLFDTLIFPQDDTSEYGMNIQEQELLSQEVLARQLYDNVFIYPGADEVASTLVARMIYDLEDLQKPVFHPFFSGQKGALSPAMYEDRPIAESVKGQVYAFGSFTIESSVGADILLAVNVPGKKQGDLALQKDLDEVDTADRNLGEWLLKVKHYLGTGKMVAIADLAYSNGADPALIPRLLDSSIFKKLTGYAGWNTAGNSLGTVIAHAAMVHLHKNSVKLNESDFTRRHYEQLLLRLLEDYLYQTIVRPQVRDRVNEPDLEEAQLLGEVKQTFLKTANELDLENLFSGFVPSITSIFLPWNRTFEIGLTVRLDERNKNEST
ncbi:DUF4127 family protein [Pseudalkalibacillus decolorationis]|uniref:DUF4127 family protein n=1 Tax=Pseudalkalibacillus decolorationis TaxID=163879 RepID=UPI0021493987|nr:DUF4127 family protein [Pseudalkalibacillus decolorationis]